MLIALIYLIYFITGVICEYESEYPDINELFPTHNDTDQPVDLPEGMSYSNVTIDIEKLDMNKFLRKMHGDLNNFSNKIKKEDDQDMSTKDLRRGGKIVYWDAFGAGYYFQGTRIVNIMVTLDSILQLIYMARNRMQRLENNDIFNTKDTGFRIGFLYNKLKIILKRMMHILGHMEKGNRERSYSNMRRHIFWHQKTIKLHVDFTYYYWVLIMLDEKFRTSGEYPEKPRLPRKYAYTGGISMEARDVYIDKLQQAKNKYSGP